MSRHQLISQRLNTEKTNWSLVLIMYLTHIAQDDNRHYSRYHTCPAKVKIATYYSFTSHVCAVPETSRGASASLHLPCWPVPLPKPQAVWKYRCSMRYVFHSPVEWRGSEPEPLLWKHCLICKCCKRLGDQREGRRKIHTAFHTSKSLEQHCLVSGK